MKDIVKKVQSFITFEAPLEIGYIQTLFAATHHQQLSMMPQWAVASTRLKLIAHYWLNQVMGHFALLLTLPVLFFLLSSGSIEHGHLLVIMAVAGLTFGVLLVFHYLPGFIRDFLPRLEAVANAYHQEQQEQTSARLKENVAQQQHEIRRLTEALSKQAEQQQEEIKKCRQAQFSNFALTLIFYVLAKTSGMADLQCNDQTANRLMQLYGIDPGSIRANLELITGSGGKRRNLSKRRRTEISNRFEEAYRFFESQEFAKGIHLLKELEIKMVGN